MPVELWIPDQDWLESTEMTVGQSEWPEAADVSELHRKDKGSSEVRTVAEIMFRRVSCIRRGYPTLPLRTGNPFLFHTPRLSVSQFEPGCKVENQGQMSK